MNRLDQLVRETLAAHADAAPPAAGVIARAVEGSHPRRRSLTVGAAVVGTVAASAAAVGGVVAFSSDPGATDVADGAPSGSPTSVLDRCLELGADALPAEHWGDGSRVLTSAADGRKVRAALVSADGTQWADCQLLAPGADQGIVMTYPMAAPEPGSSEFGYSTSSRGPLDFSMLERFPENVAEVRLIFGPGAEFTAEAVDGFVVFQMEDAAGARSTDRFRLLQYDAAGQLVGGPSLATGDADLPLEQRSLVPSDPLDSVEKVDNQ